jgi:putative restriction endonuclease
MSASVDAEVRAAALTVVHRLRESYGGRVPRAALSEGVTLGNRRVPIWNYQRGIFKPAELGVHGAALSIHTSWTSPYGDVHDLAQGTIAYKYQGSDPLYRDNVALRRALELNLPLIYLVAVDPGIYDVIAPVYVTADSPTRLEFTLVADQFSYVGHVGDAVRAAVRREYATRVVLERLHQQRFRRAVLTAYREQCSICRLKHIQLLDAAHILPDRHPNGEPVVSNGLGLCKIHHSAYDANIIGIDPSARVHVREDILAEVDGPMLKHGLQGAAGSRLIVPRDVSLQPSPDFLAERFARFRAA